MKKEKLFFILSLLSIIFLIFLTQITPMTTGKVSSIKYSQTKITIGLENQQTLILFDTKPLNLKRGDTISFKGRKEIYQDKENIIINKLIKIN